MATVGDNYWTFWKLLYNFDPIPYGREVVDVQKIPALVAYGELDEADNVTVISSVRRFEDEVDGKTLTVRVYPNTAHNLMDEELGNEHQFQLVDGSLRDLDAWIDTNIVR